MPQKLAEHLTFSRQAIQARDEVVHIDGRDVARSAEQEIIACGNDLVARQLKVCPFVHIRTWRTGSCSSSTFEKCLNSSSVDGPSGSRIEGDGDASAHNCDPSGACITKHDNIHVIVTA